MKLKSLIKKYISYKRNLGADFSTNANILKRYLREMGGKKDVTEICPQNVETFVLDPKVKPSYQIKKYGALNGLYKYAISRGYAMYSPLPKELPKKSEQFVPYIYSNVELHNLLIAALTYEKCNTQIRPLMIRAILLILYGAGLRISEAISLLMKDVSLDQSLIIVRESKFHKTRLVPLGSQLTKEMKTYLNWRNQMSYPKGANTPFFINKKMKPVSRRTFESIFRHLCKTAGISRSGGNRNQPRLQDLRHSFAVHRLISWYQNNEDVQQLLPLLSTFLGHIDLNSTTVYLSMTPELLNQANLRFEHYVFKGGENE